eukprot:jgi/Botrbrau1/297/Bobra.0022s0263.1
MSDDPELAGANEHSSKDQTTVKNLVRSAKASLELQRKSLKEALDIVEGKIQLLHDLEKQPVEDKRRQLFNAWDLDGDGFVDFSEMAVGLHKIQPEAMLGGAADAAIGSILRFDTDNNQRLDQEEFDKFAESLAEKMGSNFLGVAELLLLAASEAAEPRDLSVLNLIQDEAVKEVRSAQEYALLSQDPRMERLFRAFDKNSDGAIDFKELVFALKKLNPTDPLSEARTAAVEAMLLYDSDSSRTLDQLEFARFISRLFLLVGQQFGSLAEGLLELALAADSEVLQGPDQKLASSINSEGFEEQIYETLADRKLHTLFNLLDRNGDGRISFSELVMALRKFASSAASLNDAAADAADALLIFDTDADQHLDPREFASFIVTFADAVGTDFTGLADFLIMLAVVHDVSPVEELALLLAEDSVNQAMADARLEEKRRD